MRNLCEAAIDKFRDANADRLYGTKDEERPYGGAFLVPLVSGSSLLKKREYARVIASSGEDQPRGWRWDHVSVSLSDRCPTWEEMDFVKRLFFRPDEVVFQLHVAEKDHISDCDYCLHLWRPLDDKVPLPPPEMVGRPKR